MGELAAGPPLLGAMLLSLILGEVEASSFGAELALAEEAGEAGTLESGPPPVSPLGTAGSVGGSFAVCCWLLDVLSCLLSCLLSASAGTGIAERKRIRSIYQVVVEL